MTRFLSEVITFFSVRSREIIGGLVIASLLLFSGISMAQQTSTSYGYQSIPSSINPQAVARQYEIRQRFLTQQQDALIREARIVQSCIESARQGLYDTKGQVNRTAQMALENCAARAAALDRKSKKLEREGRRLSWQASNEISIVRGLLTDYYTRRALARGSSSSSD